MALNIEELNDAIVQSGLKLSVEDRRKILEEARKIEEEKKAERENNKEPKSKNEFCVLIRGDESLKEIVQEAWVVQVPTHIPQDDLIERVKKASRDHNQAVKRKGMCNTFRDAFQYVKRKFSKDNNYLVKTKEPCRVHILTKEYINEE